LSYLAIGIGRYIIEHKRRLEVMPYSSLGMDLLLIRLFRLTLVLYTVDTIAFTWFLDDTEFPLRPKAKVNFI
jgi:hypothetical protein